MNDDIKQNIRERKTWLRGLYMLLFLVCNSVAKVILYAVIAFQFVLTLLSGKTNERLLKLGQSLSTYTYQILAFLTFNSDQHPYPLGAWPKGEPVVKKKAKNIEKKETEEESE